MNIEKTISEHAVADILTPMLDSQDRIVTEDVAPLFDQATGLDTPPASGTVTTTIEESRSVIIAIIRRAWTATLTMLCGASVISYIAAAYTYLRNRLQGNETYGIPDRRSEISASSPLAANLALLNDRKIGGADVPDGMSLIHLLSDSSAAATVTELTDDNVGWTMNRNGLSAFPNLLSAELNCSTIATRVANLSQIKRLVFHGVKEINYNPSNYESLISSMPNLEELEFPDLEIADMKGLGTLFDSCPKLKRIYLPKTHTISACNNGTFVSSTLEEIDMPSLLTVLHYNWGGFPGGGSAVWYMRLGRTLMNGKTGTGADLADKTNLVHLEFADGLATSTNISGLSPTNALDASRTDLIEEGSTAENNLQQFLQNFRDVLFTRLAQRTSTTSLTLTLSQAVYKAVYGLDADYNVDPDALAQTASLADFGVTTEDLNEIEIAAGITTATKYATWLDTYRGAIYWNVQYS